MRVEYTFKLDDVDVPRLAVESVEGIGKLFTLATLVLNVLAVKPKVELVFHGLNPEDPGRKIEAFKRIVATSSGTLDLDYHDGDGGSVPGSSSYFQWLVVERAR